MRTCRSSIFEADLKLHLYSVNDACVLTSSAVVENRKNSFETRQIPSTMKNTSHHLTPSSDDSEFDWKWLRKDEPDCKCKTRLFSFLFLFGLNKHLLNVRIKKIKRRETNKRA